MNSITAFLGTFSRLLQGQLFPVLTEELGPLGDRHQAFVRALALLQLDGFVARRGGPGRPAYDRASVARAVLAKAVFNIPHTRALLDRLAHDPILRRLCGWERAAEVPQEWVFSRAFNERSEEHTSELQSPKDHVCRLLLEKTDILRDPSPDKGSNPKTTNSIRPTPTH